LSLLTYKSIFIHQYLHLETATENINDQSITRRHEKLNLMEMYYWTAYLNTSLKSHTKYLQNKSVFKNYDTFYKYIENVEV
jgi:hypothetical protein